VQTNVATRFGKVHLATPSATKMGGPNRTARFTPCRRPYQPCSLAVISAMRLPWNFAPSSSCSEGWRDPSVSEVVVMP
jgi:hypothetical protein